MDALTIRDRKGKLEGLNLTILGDICTAGWRDRTFTCWENLEWDHTVRAGDVDAARTGELGGRRTVRRVIRIEESPGRRRRGSIGLRVQTERLHEPSLCARTNIFSLYHFTPTRLKFAKPDAIVLHPGPMISRPGD